MSTIKNVIIDVDTGIDDAWAIFMLLKFEQQCSIKVQAITCVHGNAKSNQVALNVLKVLQVTKRLDIPIYIGSNEPFIMPGYRNSSVPYYGSDGFCNATNINEMVDERLIKTEHACMVMAKILKEMKNVSILAIGPLTNLALLLKLFPALATNIESVYILGGNRNGIGNVTRVAEFNFYLDPEAAHIVLQNLKCDVIVLPWETCQESNMLTLDWRNNDLGAISSPTVSFMNSIENYCKVDSWMPCDAFLVAVFLDPKLIVKDKLYNATVELAGNYARGQMILDHLAEQPLNCRIIEKIDEELFKRMLLHTANV